MYLVQPLLIDSILEDVGISNIQPTKKVPAASTNTLQRDLHLLPFNGNYHYQSVIGKLNYLEKSTRSDIALLRKLEERHSAQGRKYNQVKVWVRNYVRQVSSAVGVQVTDDDNFINNGSRVHGVITIP